ncbi:hypothetical protein P171DRAFT_482910 [Karstenula rhodostoma CBS 690.94]|uniref:Uncharacterized protein n=1 Tax=Karstenula rhodostoma CBS 690.94 TaxID=1392251 RepID=A0A9P4PMT9_9PLEO|nr:hypothetical protein P171DRAFT_482910 [Karstenula rhodostoma CBS 690.94]
MAGRILPIALAIFAGVSIGVSTFGEEFKEQQRRRLQQEYNRCICSTKRRAIPNGIKHDPSSATRTAPGTTRACETVKDLVNVGFMGLVIERQCHEGTTARQYE